MNFCVSFHNFETKIELNFNDVKVFILVEKKIFEIDINQEADFLSMVKEFTLRKRLFAARVHANKNIFAARVPANRNIFAGRFLGVPLLLLFGVGGGDGA